MVFNKDRLSELSVEQLRHYYAEVEGRSNRTDTTEAWLKDASLMERISDELLRRGDRV